MAIAEEGELVERFQQFYRRYCSDDVGLLAQEYPKESKSLHVDWDELHKYDPDLADDYLQHPEEMQGYAEEALRLYDLPVDISLGQAHVRVQNLPEIVDIRDIRARHVNTFVSVQGLIRKATDVRPKIQEAAFECQRCGTLSYIPQAGGSFQEPHECQGCERQGPFQINFDQSEFVDAQKLRVQESPEGLRGGETPQSIDIHIEDDVTGEVSPGDHITATGVLRIEQQGNAQEKSRMFDLFMDGHSIAPEEEVFEDMDITEEDKRRIIELSNEENIYDLMVQSIAPAIYGYEQAKTAMILQLFSGVTKHLPDGTRIRGDLHMLLIGDPGTGKCVKGDTRVTLADGSERRIQEIVEENLTDPLPIDDGVYQEVDIPIPTLNRDGRIVTGQATKVWKRDAPETMYRIYTTSGTEIEVTPSHPLFVQRDGSFVARKAERLRDGEFIAVPRSIPADGNDSLDVAYRDSKANNAVVLDLPDEWTPSLARLVGYVIAEGYVTLRDDHTGDIRITNNDEEVLEDVRNALGERGINHAVRGPRAGKSAREIICCSGEFASFLATVEPSILDGSADQRVPDAVMRASQGIKAAFVKAFVEGEGHVSTSQREISVASMSKELLEGVRSILLSLGITSQLSEHVNGSFRLRVSGSDFNQYLTEVGFVTERKGVAATAYEGTNGNTNRDVIPDIGNELRRIRKRLYLSQFECGIPRSTYQHYERGDRNPGRESLDTVISAFEDRLEWLRAVRTQTAEGDWTDIEAVRSELDISQQELADEIGVEQTAVSYYERNTVAPDGGRVLDATAFVVERIDTALRVADDVRALRTLVDGDVSWDRIERIELIEPDYEWVYDLEVEGTHNYLSNNVVSHNSQMLQYIREIAPRSVYTSGKGSSTAGLTAAAVRDDFAEGQQWTLEAGALVMADQGIAAVDELDKMRPEDRSALHEGLEQQKISISKAGINATLKSRCSLLGAANPKYGRFDQYESFGEQIDLEPALISRFDLIFTVTDQPDPEHDQRLADHILRTNFAGELNTQRENLTTANVSLEEVQSVTDEVKPAIEADLLRKYIAYAKRQCFPTMTDEAMEAIRDFYVDLRAKGADEDAPVPVTARKLEGLVRLSEASARLRLSDRVERHDADRVIEIVRSCLQDIGVDPETGQFDADVVETGRSKTQRDRVKNIRALIGEIEQEYDEGAPIDTVLDRAEEVGLERSKAEHEIEKLKQKGEVYEPTNDHLRTT